MTIVSDMTDDNLSKIVLAFAESQPKCMCCGRDFWRRIHDESCFVGELKKRLFPADRTKTVVTIDTLCPVVIGESRYRCNRPSGHDGSHQHVLRGVVHAMAMSIGFTDARLELRRKAHARLGRTRS